VSKSPRVRNRSDNFDRSDRQFGGLMKAFVWVLLAVFILTSVGVALVMVR
jgi:hypothetical protein